MRAFSSGSTSARTSSMPSRPRHRPRRPLAVAGRHDDAEAEPRAARRSPPPSSPSAGRRPPTSPASRPSIATAITVSPASAARVGLGRRRRHPERGHHPRRCRARPPGPRRVPRTPMPVDRLEVRHRRQRDAPRLGAADDRLGERMLGAALEARGEAQELGLVAPRARAARRRAPACRRSGCRSCRRRGCRRRRAVSSASASRTSTPACAPRPVAVMIDIGVARPSAQGQAMISTEIAAISA